MHQALFNQRIPARQACLISTWWLAWCIMGMCAYQSFEIVADWPVHLSLWLIVSIGMILHWGWIIPCTLLGNTFARIYNGSAVYGGTLESQLQEQIARVVLATCIGLLIGFVLQTTSKNGGMSILRRPTRHGRSAE